MARKTPTYAQRLVAYEEITPDAEETTEFSIPEDLTELSDEDLTTLRDEAIEHFDSIYGEGTDLSDEDVAALAALTESIEALNAEVESREQAAEQRSAQAAELASRVRGADASDDEEEDEEDDEAEAEAEVEASTEDEEVQEPEAVAASSRRTTRVPVRSRRRAPSHTPSPERQDVMFASDAPGLADGEAIDIARASEALARRLASFPAQQYAHAARSGRNLREQHSLAVLRKPFEDDMIVRNSDPEHVEQVLSRAVDQSRLEGDSLVAAGGWSAPSELFYEQLELESRDGLFTLPEVAVARGGFQFTKGVDFADIYAGTGFAYTEQQDIDGNYGVDENGVGNDTEGTKPCYRVPDVDFEEVRLQVAGLCIQAGLLQARGYPEIIARVIRGALVAHDHKMAQRKIDAIKADSTAVTLPAGQVGTAAPLLTAIELQAEHILTRGRISRSTTIEGVFPMWVRSAVRADLSRRLGVDLLSVTDAQITSWFTARGIVPQFVYGVQDLEGEPGDVVAWPETVEFLMYPAGTWVAGSTDIITLDTLYDSTLLGTNDYTALFTEEGWLVAKRGVDSRHITVPIATTGATAGGVVINHDGTAGTEG